MKKMSLFLASAIALSVYGCVEQKNPAITGQKPFQETYVKYKPKYKQENFDSATTELYNILKKRVSHDDLFLLDVEIKKLRENYDVYIAANTLERITHESFDGSETQQLEREKCEKLIGLIRNLRD